MAQLKRMFRNLALAAFATVLVGLVSGEARAEQARSWTLESQSGQVHLAKPGIAPISLSTGDVFSDGDWIQTGPDGRAMLRRGEETIVVAPNSRIGLPKNNDGPYATRILQTLGTILLTVEKKAAQHFQVETPYLTAVVKGTTFTVGIQDGRSVVHVVEGLVEVKNLSSGRSNLVRPGQTGSVVRDGGDVELGGGDVKNTSASAAAVPAQGENQENAQVASQASPVAVVAVPQDTSGKVKAAKVKKAVKVRILQALGPTTLDLSRSTKGLVRAARDGQGNALGKGYTAGKKADAGSGLKAGSKASKVGKGTSVASGLKAGGKGPKVGKSARAASGLGSSGSTALALSNSVSAGLTSPGSSNGLDVGKEAKKAKNKSKGRGKSK